MPGNSCVRLPGELLTRTPNEWTAQRDNISNQLFEHIHEYLREAGLY